MNQSSSPLTLAKHDEFLYQALEENIQVCRHALLNQGIPREARAELYSALSQCKELQTKLVTRPLSSEDTADFDISKFKK